MADVSFDVNTSDNLGWLVVIFIPAAVLVIFGAAIGAVARTELDRSRRHARI